MKPTAIIDPPVGPYSDPDAIRDWIAELRAMPDVEAVRQAIREAEQLLEARLAAVDRDPAR